jgi:glycosyltransferase involved in cell wall biosynthesis
MKIIHFLAGRCNPDSANGVEKAIYYIAVNQSAQGHDTYIFGISEKPPLPIAGVTVVHFSAACMPWQLSKGLLKRIIEISPDIVHIHCIYIPQNVVLGYRLKYAGIPYVVTPHGNCSRESLKRRAYLKVPFKLLVERPYLNRALAVHSVGDADAIREYGITAPIIEAPNGIDLITIPASTGSNPILSARPEWAGRVIFLYIGRLDTEQKGLDLLIAAFAEAVSAGGKLGLMLVGPDWRKQRAMLMKQVSNLSLEDSVHFAGPVYAAEKYDYLLSCQYFVHTSRWEGLPFAVVEALACGKACLVTPAANPAGLIGTYPAGWQVAPIVSDIAKALLDMSILALSDRQVMEESARLLVENELQWHKIASKLTHEYQDLKDRNRDCCRADAGQT